MRAQKSWKMCIITRKVHFIDNKSGFTFQFPLKSSVDEAEIAACILKLSHKRIPS